MSNSDRQSAGEIEIRLQERTAELEKANQVLHAEILERKQEKHIINRYKNVLEGINRIFGSVVKAETEEDLGNACISVAMEISGSQLGFVGELGSDGLMHDIAIRYTGWDQCMMYDRTGPRLPMENSVLRGLYGSVVDSGKGFFTNDPASHPDSIDLPQDNPPLKSFLGVPLIENGKTVGVLAVANREGGYSCEQQEDLEAVAPAVVHVLQRKREENKREQAEKTFQTSESRYRSLYENSLDGILLTRPDGTILSANPQACHMFGMTEDEIIRAGREGIVVKDEKLAAALEDRELKGWMRAELTHRRKDGSTFVAEVTSHLFADADGSIMTSMIVRDVTERKQMEEALREKEERFTAFMDNSPAVAWMKDEQGRHVYMNKSCENRFNVRLVDWMGKTDFEMWPLNVAEQFRENDRAVLKGDQTIEVVEETPNPEGGSTFWWNFKFPFMDASDKKYVGGIGIDITERKQAEEALKLSNIYNRSLIEASLDPLVTFGRDGKITDVNGATEQVTGYSRNELIGTDFSNYFTEPEKASAGYQHVFTDGKVWDYPLEIQHKDGHIIPVLYNASVYRDENGEVVGVFAAARDITERKKAEEALKKVHDNLENLVEERTKQLEKAYNSLKESEEGLAEAQRMAHIGNWRWDIVTGELFWSDEVYRIFGLNPQEFRITYDLFLSCVHPDDQDYLINAINEGLNGNPFAVEYRIIPADGEERIVLTESKVISYEENNPIQAKGIVQDITERKRAEKELEKVNRIRIKEIHHRIKNNLQVISSLLDLQAEKFRNKEVLKAFRESQNRILSMSLIHEELYNGEGTDKLNFSAYIQKLAVNLFQTYSLRSKNIRLLMDLEENAFFDMDTAIPLGIIVNELISNSLKHAFTENQEGEIRIRLCREEENRRRYTNLFST